jgi:hypothetical protein
LIFFLRIGKSLLPLHSASEGTGKEIEGRKERGRSGEEEKKRKKIKILIFFLQKRKSFLPLQSQTKGSQTDGVREALKKRLKQRNAGRWRNNKTAGGQHEVATYRPQGCVPGSSLKRYHF